MWRNHTVADFVEWLHNYNRGFAPPSDPVKALSKGVGFYGLDVYSLHTSAQAVIQYLKEADPQAAKVAEARYKCFDK
jgi:erythromycin esterase-like protein